MGQGASRRDGRQNEAARGGSHGGILTGCDVLRAESFERLRGSKVGLIANATSVLRDLTHLADAIHGFTAVHSQAPFHLVAIFGPEHGFRGTAQAGKSESASKDPKTGLPIFDLYGKDSQSIAKCFEASGADTIVFDIQDVGARFYTFIWTLYDCLVAAALCPSIRRFLVLDRPNPLGGVVVDGPITEPQHASFVGRKAIPLRHGMTVGELSLLFLSEFLPPDPHLAKLNGGGSATSSSSSSSSSGGGTTTTRNSSGGGSSSSGSSQPFAPAFKLEVVQMEGWSRSSSPFFPFFPCPQPLLSPAALTSRSPAPVSAPPPSPSPSPSHSASPVTASFKQQNVSIEAPSSSSISPPATVAALLSSATVAGATAAGATVPTALQPLLWVPPSPNMPTPTTALVYAGTCLIEGTNLSEGRGTTLPFQLIGAPFMDHRFAQAVRDQRCPGCAIREAYFSPVAGKFSGKQVCGIEIHVTEPSAFDPLRLALILLSSARALYPSHFHWRNDSPTTSPNGPFWIDKLAGSDSLRKGVDAGRSVDEIKAGWQPQLMWFSTIRAQYLLYTD